MQNLLDHISTAGEHEIGQIIACALDRYHALYPNRQMHTILLVKNADKNRQIDELIALMKTMKE